MRENHIHKLRGILPLRVRPQEARSDTPHNSGRNNSSIPTSDTTKYAAAAFSAPFPMPHARGKSYPAPGGKPPDQLSATPTKTSRNPSRPRGQRCREAYLPAAAAHICSRSRKEPRRLAAAFPPAGEAAMSPCRSRCRTRPLGVIQREKPRGRSEARRPARGLLCAAIEIVIVPSANITFHSEPSDPDGN